MPYFEKAGYTVDAGQLAPIIPIIQTRMTTLDEGPELAGFFFREEIAPPVEMLVGKDMTAAQSAAAVRKAVEILEVLPEFSAANAEAPMRAVAEELGLKAGQFFGILRNAVTGQEVSPPLFESMEIIGRDIVLARLKRAISELEKIAEKS